VNKYSCISASNRNPDMIRFSISLVQPPQNIT
jgi:hypothetical protein